ncbi:MAG TPA: GAF domain-containing sensor histidine kinase [Gemmatimonadaceae bacterium]
MTASTLAATVVTFMLRPFLSSATFVFYYAAVGVSAMYAGWPGGIATAIAGAALGNYLVIHFEHFTEPTSVVGTISFLAMSAVISAIASAMRRAHTAFELHNIRLRQQAGELEAQQAEAQALAEELERANIELERTNRDLEKATADAEGSRDDALEARDRLQLVDEASRLLASSLDYETTVAAAARLAVPRFADWCAVDLLVDGEIRQLALVHVDPAMVQRARELAAKYPTPIDAPTGVPHVIRTGQPQLITRITDDTLREFAQDEEHLKIMRSAGMHSAMIVPMIARGTTIGALTLISVRPSVEYDADSLALADQLARRAAIAIDNARLYRAALAANESKAAFLATMSHELRTPLTAIIGYEELLAEGITGHVSDEQRHQLGRIKASAKHLLSLIDQILLFTRVDAGRETVETNRVVVKPFVEEALSMVGPKAEEKGLQLSADPIDPRLTLETDANKLRQMLLNLLTNAIKFTKQGRVVVCVHDTVEAVTFEVQDTGLGIARDDLDRIFDPFWQVEQSKARNTTGTGLGLTVTRRLAELLGGTVSVESEPSVGSTFRIVLPKKTPVSEATPRAA